MHLTTRIRVIAVIAVIAILFSLVSAFAGTADLATAEGDSQPPQVLDLAVDSQTIDASGGGASVTFTARITDDVSGYNWGYIQAAGPNGNTEMRHWTRQSGDANDGIYTATLSFSEYAPEGDWSLAIALQDAADNGNTLTGSDLSANGWPDHITVSYSGVAPCPPTSVSAVAGDGSATVSWDAPQDVGANELTDFEVTVEPGGKTVTTSPDSTSSTLTGLSNGTEYTFTVAALNSEAKSEPSAPSNPVVPADTTGPTTTIEEGPSGTVETDTAIFEFSGSKTVSMFECRLDDETWQTCTPPHELSGLADGEHTFHVRATDEVGNTGPATSRTWTVVTQQFSDVPKGHPFFDEIEWLATTGITTGYDDGTFRPGQQVTRQATAAFFYRHAHVADTD